MKKGTWKCGLAAMLGLVLSIQAPVGALIPRYQTFGYTQRSATINASSLNVRSGPGTSNSSVAKLTRGTAITVIDETTGSDGKLWYQIRFTGSGGTSTTGYVLGTYVRFPVTYSHDSDFESYLNAQGFPDSYKDGLRQLHAQYPNWVFTAQQTGLDWNTVIENEGVLGRNLVHTDSISSYKSLVDGAYNWDNGTWTGFDGSTWVAASEDILRYYMDPRNFLDEVSVFQFLSQEYDASLHTKEGLQSMLNGTFMEGTLKANGGSGSAGSSTGSDSSGSAGSDSSGSVTSGGPGVSGGSQGSTSVTPGGQSAVIVAPDRRNSSGSSDSSSSGNSSSGSDSGSSDSGSAGTGATGGASEVPAGTNPEVQLQAPQASISRHDAAIVGTATVITAGPPTGDQSQSQGGNQSQTVTSPTPGGTEVSTDSGSVPSASGATQDTQGGTTYADVLMQAAAGSGVNPYVLAAMIIQEQGRDGRGNSIKGDYGGYTGYYNYFNVGAYASDGMSAVVRGLWYASQSGSYGRPWNSVASSIIGGSQFYGTNYVDAGQDTLYLKKYNVQGSNIYKHQYMTNVDGAEAEGCIFAEGFSAELKSTALQFKIPVYQNMPETPCAQPTQDGSPNNKLNGLGADGFALTPTFNKDTNSYDLIVDHSVGEVNIYASAIDSKASVSGTGTVQLQSGINEIRVVVRAENGSEREYVIHIVRQNNGPTYNAGMSNGSSSGTGSGSGSGTSSGTTSGGTSAVPGGGTAAGPGVVGPGSSSPGTGAGSGTDSGTGTGSGDVLTPGGSNVTVISPAG